MNDSRVGQMPSGKTLHPRPRPSTATSLASSANTPEPKADDLFDEAIDTNAVAGNGMIVQPSLHNTS